MTDFVPPKKNDANGYIFYVALFDAAIPGSLKASATLATGDVKISKDGGGLSNLGTLPVVTPAASVWVKVVLSQTEINADNIAIQFIDQTATKEWTDYAVNFQTATRQLADVAFPTVSGRSMDVDANGGVEIGSFQAGAITTAAFTAGAINAAAIATDAIGSAEFSQAAADKIWATAARTLTASLDPTSATIAAAVWDLDATAHQTQGTFGQAIGDPVANTGTIFKAVVTDPTGVTVGADTAAIITTLGAAGAGLTAVPFTNVWSVATRVLTAGTNIVLAKGTGITGLNDLDAAGIRTATGLASANLDTQLSGISTKTTNLPSDPADESLIIAATDAIMTRLGVPSVSVTADIAGIQSDTNDIQTRLPATLSGGRMDASVGALQTTTNLGYSVPAIARGTAAGGGSTTSIPTSAFTPAGAAADQFKGRVVLFDAATATAALRGCARTISASSNAATPTLTVDTLPRAPSAGDVFSVI